VSEAALPTLAQAPRQREEPSPDWLRAARRARALSWLSLAWMGAEGAIAIAAGVMAGSIALIGFGVDSAIEGFASVVIVWRFSGRQLLSHAAEERAQRLVAVQFFLLAPYVAFEAIRHLVTGDEPETSVLGMVLTATSLVGMPFLGVAKQRLAQKLGSSATHGEGAQNLLCAYLAGAVFLGLAGNTLFGWWWLDPIAALVVAGVAVKEGRATWRGEGCCAAPELDPGRLLRLSLRLSGAPGEAEHGVERWLRAGPVLTDHVGAGGAEDAAQHERHDDRVVELAGDGDEVGDEVEWHREVGDEGEQQELATT
jgi:hypothetical protein